MGAAALKIAPPSAVDGFRRHVAILFAIGAYENDVPALRTPVTDADDLAAVLRELHGFEAEVVCDAAATGSAIADRLRDLADELSGEDRVVVYFAGHGIAIDNVDGPEGFLLPFDARRDDTKSFLPMAVLNELLGRLPCRHLLAVLDCCFAGALRWSSTRNFEIAAENVHRERFEWFIRDRAWQAIASAAHDQKALDVVDGEPLGARDRTDRNSPFAAALIAGLKGDADRVRRGGEPDGIITATELFLHLEDSLAPREGRRRIRQTPVFWPLQKHENGQFVFLTPGLDLALEDAPPLDSANNPWRGLRSYEPADTETFFGRGVVSDQLAADVAAKPLVVVTGPSGVGKSSLVLAGLLPRLPAETTVAIVRPGPAPMVALAAALELDRDNAAVLATDPDALARVIGARGEANPLVLVIDQIEELITQQSEPEVRLQFLRLLHSALGECPENLKVVVTVRSDLEPAFLESILGPLWERGRFFVRPMRRDELKRVVDGPAAVKVLRFDPPELVDELVDEVQQMPGALPLLSFALSEMYSSYLERRGGDRTLTRDDYAALRGGVAGALRTRANLLLESLDPESRTTARRVLERLVSIAGGELSRRRVPRFDFETDDVADTARAMRVLAALEAARLAVADVLEDVPHVELAHDALILGWDVLHTWIRADAPLLADARRLEFDARAWANDHRKNAGLLWDDDARVGAILRLVAAEAPGLNRLEAAFAAASRRRARRNRILLIVIVVALVALSFGAGVAALSARRSAMDAIASAGVATKQEALARASAKVAAGQSAKAAAAAREALEQRNVAEQRRLEAEARTKEAQDAKAATERALVASQASLRTAQAREIYAQRPDLGVAYAMDALRLLEPNKLNATEALKALRASLAASNGQRLYCLPQIETYSNVMAIALGRQGRVMAAGTRDGSLCLYQRAPDNVFRIVEGLQSFGTGPGNLLFSEGDHWLVSTTMDGYLRALDMSTVLATPEAERFGKNNYDFKTVGEADKVAAVAMSGDGKRLAFYRPETQAIEIWNMSDFDPDGRPALAIPVALRPIALTLDDRSGRIAALLAEPPKAGSEHRLLKGADAPRLQIEFWNGDGRHAATLPNVLEDLAFFMDERLEGGIQVSPDGNWAVASVRLDDSHRTQPQYAVEFWRLGPEKPVRVKRFDGTYEDPARRPTAAGLAGNNWFYAASDADIRAWRLQPAVSEEPDALLTTPSTGGVTRRLGVINKVAASSDGFRLATADSNGVLAVWELGTDVSGKVAPLFVVPDQDPQMGDGETVEFGAGSGLVAMGGKGVQICRLGDGCGPVEPRRNSPPISEGQWINWGRDPKRRWMAAASESRHVHVWDLDDGHPLIDVALELEERRDPLKSQGYVISSGSPGRPVFFHASPNGDWLVAFVAQQYGFHSDLTLIRLGKTPSSVRLTPADYGCGDFAYLDFQPDGRRLALSNKPGVRSEPCIAVLDLPADDAATAAPVRVQNLKVAKAGSVHLSADGATLIADAQYGETATIFHRQGDGTYGQPEQVAGASMGFDPTRQRIIRRTGSDNEKLLTLEGPGGKRAFGPFFQPDIGISADGRWLAVTSGDPKSGKRNVDLWDTSANDPRSLHYVVPMENVDSSIVFSPDGGRLVVGPDTFERPSDRAPVSNLAAILIDLRAAAPHASVFAIPRRDYESDGTVSGGIRNRPSANSESLTYEFSQDGRWLLTSDPGALFWLDSGAPRLVAHLGDAQGEISPDSAVLAESSPSGVRLWRLNPTSLEPISQVASSGAISFRRNGQLDVFADGTISSPSLAEKELQAQASMAFGRNPTVEDWARLFPDRPYVRLYPNLPADISEVAMLLERASQAVKAGDRTAAARDFSAATQAALEGRNVRLSLQVVEAGLDAGLPASVAQALQYALKVLPKDRRALDLKQRFEVAARRN